MAESERAQQHRHCLKCGRAFTGDGRYCGDGCNEVKKRELNKEKRKLLAIWAAGVALMVIVIALML